MKNFFNNCLDHHLITEYIVIDDNSSEEDRLAMKIKFPNFKFILKGPTEKGHSKSLNMIPKYVKTKYFLNWEDDTEFINPKNYITNSIDILENNEANNYNIKQVLFNDSGFSYQQKKNKDLNFTYPHRYLLHLVTDETIIPKLSKDFIIGIHHWPGYSDNAYIMHTNVINNIGEFNNNPSTSEVDFSIRFRNNGFRTCYLIGSGLKWNSKTSAYILNGQNRWWDNTIFGVLLLQIKYIFTHFFKIQTWITVWNIISGKV